MHLTPAKVITPLQPNHSRHYAYNDVFTLVSDNHLSWTNKTANLKLITLLYNTSRNKIHIQQIIYACMTGHYSIFNTFILKTVLMSNIPLVIEYMKILYIFCTFTCNVLYYAYVHVFIQWNPSHCLARACDQFWYTYPSHIVYYWYSLGQVVARQLIAITPQPDRHWAGWSGVSPQHKIILCHPTTPTAWYKHSACLA